MREAKFYLGIAMCLHYWSDDVQHQATFSQERTCWPAFTHVHCPSGDNCQMLNCKQSFLCANSVVVFIDLSFGAASGPIYLTMPTPGSPVYPAGMNPMDFSQALNVGMMYPYSSGSPVSSPRWQSSGNLPFSVPAPPTPPRNSRFAAQSTPFRAFVPSAPLHAEHRGGEKLTEAAEDRTSPLGLGGSFLQPGFQADSQMPMNARSAFFLLPLPITCDERRSLYTLVNPLH